MRRVVAFLGALVLVAWILVPFYLLAIAALTPPDLLSAYPKPLVPSAVSPASLETFRDAAGIAPATINSVAVAVIAVLVALVAGAPAGYALGRFTFRGRDGVVAAASIGRFFPLAVLAVPAALMLARIGLYDSVVALGVMHGAIALPFVILVIARAVALARPWPGIAAAAVLSFLISWNEVFAATVLTVQLRTLPAQVFASLATSPLSYKLAGAVVLVVPSLLAFLLIRRTFVRVWR
ncbi:MAG TPA: carbohydrate ABC transporter permease [Candidatus Limnocylindria bacterium]|jgi:multiple sugar transport system permease protein